jgi:integrase/recombinase XerD
MRQVEPLTDEDVKALFSVSEKNIQDYIIIRILAKCGLRIGELLRLRVKDVDFDKKRMWIYKSKTARGKREVKIDGITCVILKQYVATSALRGGDQIFLVPSRRVERMIKGYAKKVGIEKNVFPHSFRHYFITKCIREGMDLFRVKTLVGHVSLTTTSVYTHIATEDAEKQYDEIFEGW